MDKMKWSVVVGQIICERESIIITMMTPNDLLTFALIPHMPFESFIKRIIVLQSKFF